MNEVQNGERVAFDHPSGKGLAGLVCINGSWRLGYLAAGPRPLPPALGTVLELDGRRFRVDSSASRKRPLMHTLGLTLLDD